MTPDSQLAADSGLHPADSHLLQTQGGTSPPDPTPASEQGLPEDLLQEAAWTREDAKRWWENRMTPEPAVVLVD